MGLNVSSNDSDRQKTFSVDIPSDNRYISSFQRACAACDKDFIDSAKIAIKVKYDEELKAKINDIFYAANYKQSPEITQKLKKKYQKFYENKKLTLFLQDAYAQNMFECYVADILRHNPFDQVRKEIENLENLKKTELEQRILEFETKFNEYITNVIENRYYSDIKGSTTKIAIKSPQDWTHAFTNLKVILTQMTNGIHSSIL